jgi:hypothetical protein
MPSAELFSVFGTIAELLGSLHFTFLMGFGIVQHEYKTRQLERAGLKAL